ncbi:MAG TPA: hypothetical protein VN616_12590 [Puia sp.]|nr:hypothetical protein [Puia sp.]
MRVFLFIIFSVGSFVASAQTGRHFVKIIIDSSDANPTFDQAMSGRSETRSTHGVITNETTGKSDTIDWDISNKVINANLEGSYKPGTLFDNCIAYSYYGGDSVRLQFQDNCIELPKSMTWDRLLIHIVGDQFYAEYVYTNLSFSKLVVVGQELRLRHPASKKGESLEGSLTIRCVYVDPDARRQGEYIIRGPFRATIQ